MRSLKTTGGLTHGSGMSEEQRALWTMSSSITSAYNCAMQEFTKQTYTTSHQHKDLTESRMKRDAADMEKIGLKLAECSLFSSDPSLRNVANGFVADERVNVHHYESVGQSIIKKMVGVPAFTISFSRKDKAITQGLDPALLFQCPIVISKTEELSLEDVKGYELSPFPSSLFEAKNVFRKADKPQLAHAICDYAQVSISDSGSKTEYYVLDGGSLIHRVPWKRGNIYGEIAQSYADFTIRHYGLNATVVFDGYGEGPTIKDNTHQRRGQNIHPIVNFTAETKFDGKKDEFLSRDINKQRLINLISTEIEQKGCTVINTAGDADVDIVRSAVDASLLYSTTLIGEDTDLLVLLLYYAQENGKGIYFKSEKPKNDGSQKVYDIRSLTGRI
jgi:hypothetical protein